MLEFVSGMYVFRTRPCLGFCSGHKLVLSLVDPVYGLVMTVAKSMTLASMPGSAITTNRSIVIVTP
jgi:hypothetical protein